MTPSSLFHRCRPLSIKPSWIGPKAQRCAQQSKPHGALEQAERAELEAAVLAAELLLGCPQEDGPAGALSSSQ